MAGIGAQSAEEAVPEGMDQDGNEPATPEEQAAYERFLNAAGDLMIPQGDGAAFNPQIIKNLSGQFDQEILQMMQGVEPPVKTDNPIEALAATSVVVVMLTESILAEQGDTIPQEIIYHASTEIVAELARTAEDAGVNEYSEEDINDAFLRGLDLYRQASPNVDQQALSQQFDEIVAADRSGQLDKVLPKSLLNAAPKGAAPPAPEEGAA